VSPASIADFGGSNGEWRNRPDGHARRRGSFASSPVFQSRLTSTDHPDTSPFSFVAAIAKDGRVLRLYVDHETNIYTCARQTLQKEEFPHPPLAPYYLHISMSFQ
jgi:hypothetical protein